MGDENGLIKGDCAFSTHLITKINDMHTLVDNSHRFLSNIVSAQNSMAESAHKMAVVNEHADIRYAKLEDRLQEAYDKASGKSQIPIISHLLILGTTVLVTLVLVLYVTQTTLDATLTSVKVKQGAQDKVE